MALIDTDEVVAICDHFAANGNVVIAWEPG